MAFPQTFYKVNKASVNNVTAAKNLGN